ncbi:neurogenic locus notch homolog protein 1-like [Argopecten irradians]|uniref:neurogenic locus notch homolog protein 1-like n=1 Tax=Argopecten irradians TaxID=31199 RepID=UPI00371D0A1E
MASSLVKIRNPVFVLTNKPTLLLTGSTMNALFGITLIGLAAICQAFLVADRNECTTNSDCQANVECCVSDYHGHYCAPYQNETDPCHRPGHTAYVYKCGCRPGLTCEHVNLHTGTVTPSNDPLTGVEGAIENAGLGFCSGSAH